MKITNYLLQASVFVLVLCGTKNGYSDNVFDAQNYRVNKEIENVGKDQLKQQEKLLGELINDSLLNTTQPDFWVWNKANSFESNLEVLKNKFDIFSDQGLEDYLNNYHDVDFYKDSKCFKFGGCSPKQMEELAKYKKERLEAMRKSSIDIAKGINNYLVTTTKDLEDIEELKLMTKSADGQMKSAQYSNQWLYIQTKILMDLNANMQILQNQIRVVVDELYASKAIKDALSNRATLKTLETDVQSLPTNYEFLNLK